MLPDLKLRPLRELALAAASGLVARDGLAWVVADDRLALHGYSLPGGGPPTVLALAPAAAGPDAPLPKKVKPDLEALCEAGDGRLLALGSGSRATRDRGFAVDPMAGTVQPQQLAALYRRLRRRFGELNVEGAVRCGDTLLLAHRGLGDDDPNRVLVLDAQRCLAAPRGRWPAQALRRVVKVRLGKLDGVPLGFTDLALHPARGLHYLATAERTDDAYADGVVAGSVFGRLDDALRPQPLARLRPDLKCEGLALWKSTRAADHWLVVTDADDPARAARLMTLHWPAGG